MDKKAGTRERILTVSQELFNNSGTGPVTTNHIAEAAGLSVGNLYYHYKNKEEIIRALYERLAADFDAIFAPPEDSPLTLTDLERMLRANYEALYQYRFFYRELLALLQRDPLLKARYLEIRLRGYEGFAMLLTGFAQSGILRPMDDAAEISQMAQICWILSDFYLSFVESGGAAVEPAHMNGGIDLLRRFLQPYLMGEKQ
jgi:AcrR family transcriptional regulator